VLKGTTFTVEEACSCSTRNGEVARSIAANRELEALEDASEDAALRELMSDDGMLG
jgi:hypothetical protein